MNRLIIFILLTVLLCLSTFPALAGVSKPVNPVVTSPRSCNKNYEGHFTKKKRRTPSCTPCDERSGSRYAKYNGKDSCVYCDEKNGWRYDGIKYCIK